MLCVLFQQDSIPRSISADVKIFMTIAVNSITAVILIHRALGFRALMPICSNCLKWGKKGKHDCPSKENTSIGPNLK